MVGNSLSFCVRDIMEGLVAEQDVEVIRCSFKAPYDFEHFLEVVVSRYRKIYWVKNPDLGQAIAERLYKAGKLQFTGGHYLKNKWGEDGLLHEQETMQY